ncbi:MAG TPA: ABC transporter substrate-binding protein [Chloroflexota bacterium]|nr:ABC transporter substrate-binding protein [Chloroflexota bacterium]
MRYLQAVSPRLVLTAVLLLTACTPPVSIPTASHEPSAPPVYRAHVRSAYTSESALELPLWMAHEAGLFAQHGLEVTVERIAGGSSKAMQVLIAGELDILHGSGPAVVDARLAGADVVAIAIAYPVLGINLYAVPDIVRLEDLRGRAVAITRAGTLSDFGARYALTRYGLRPEVDVGLVQTGGNTETIAAMQAGHVAAGVIASPFDVPARKLGFHELLDLASLGLEFPTTGLLVQRDYLVRHEEVLRSFLRAYVEAIARIQQDKPFAKQVISKYASTTDEEALESSYAAFGQRYLTRAPYPTVAQFQTLIEFVAEREPRARSLQPETLIDARFVRALDEEGYIDRLYR